MATKPRRKKKRRKRVARKAVGPERRAFDLSDLRIDYSGLERVASRVRVRARELSLPTVGRWLAVLAALGVLPFVLLIRGSVFNYLVWGFGTWLSLLFAALATVLLLAAYAWAVSRWLGAGHGLRWFFARGAMGVGMAYVVYALVFVASANVKSDYVRAEYRTLHPLLRVASSALFLVDPGSVITDASRSMEEYASMGLPPNEASLHFRQADGYVHAVDLRTSGRSWVRNLTLRLTFGALGFRTLRHIGTADHLHVSLPLAR